MAQDAWAKEDFAECFADFKVELCLCRLLRPSTFSVFVVVVVVVVVAAAANALLIVLLIDICVVVVVVGSTCVCRRAGCVDFLAGMC